MCLPKMPLDRSPSFAHIIMGCTYHGFGRPSNVCFEPYFELPVSITGLCALMYFEVGSHALPIERGGWPGQLRWCTGIDTQAMGHELFDCPPFSDIRIQSPSLFQAGRVACRYACGARTRTLLFFVSWPWCKGPRHEQRPILFSQAGWKVGMRPSPSQGLAASFHNFVNNHTVSHVMGVSSYVRRRCCLAVLDSCWATGPSGQHACLLLELGAHHQPFKDRGCRLQWQ